MFGIFDEKKENILCCFIILVNIFVFIFQDILSAVRNINYFTKPFSLTMIAFNKYYMLFQLNMKFNILKFIWNVDTKIIQKIFFVFSYKSFVSNFKYRMHLLGAIKFKSPKNSSA